MASKLTLAFAIFLLAVWTSSEVADAVACATVYDLVTDVCIGGAGNDFIDVEDGDQAPSLGPMNNRISQVFIYDGCALTLYTETEFKGFCHTFNSFGCYEVASAGVPSTCNPHPGSGALQQGSAPTAGSDVFGNGSVEGYHPRNLTIELPRWNNVASSYKCDCV